MLKWPRPFLTVGNLVGILVCSNFSFIWHAYHQNLPNFEREIDSEQNLGAKINLWPVMTTPISDRGKIFEFSIWLYLAMLTIKTYVILDEKSIPGIILALKSMSDQIRPRPYQTVGKFLGNFRIFHLTCAPSRSTLFWIKNRFLASFLH